MLDTIINNYKEKPGPPDPPQKFSRASVQDMFLGASVLSYFMGWIYQYYRLDGVGVAMATIDIPFHYFFVYSFSVFALHPNWSLLIFGLCVGVGILASWKPSSSKTMLVKIGAMCILIGAVFCLTYKVSLDAGRGAARALRGGEGKIVRFELRPNPTNRYPKEFLEANAANGLFLIAHSQENYVVLHQFPSEEGGALPMGTVYEVPKNDVLIAATTFQ